MVDAQYCCHTCRFVVLDGSSCTSVMFISWDSPRKEDGVGLCICVQEFYHSLGVDKTDAI